MVEDEKGEFLDGKKKSMNAKLKSGKQQVEEHG